MKKPVLDEDLLEATNQDDIFSLLKLTAIARYFYIFSFGIFLFYAIQKPASMHFAGTLYTANKLFSVLMIACIILYLNYHLKRANSEIKGTPATHQVRQFAIILASFINIAILILIVQFLLYAPMQFSWILFGSILFCVSLLLFAYRDISYLFLARER